MITYPVSNNSCKKSYLQCYRLYNLPFFRSSHWRCSKKFRKILRKTAVSKSLTHKVAGWDDCFWSFSCLLLKFLIYFISTEKWNEKREIPWWSWRICFFARVSICLTSKILKEIWQMVIWYENVFKENFMLQFSWLEEFR